MEVIISYGKIRIVSFENGYSVTHRNRVVSDRQLALYFKMPKEKLQELTVKHHAKIKEEDTEFNNTCNVALIVDYIKRTEKLIRPYYSKKEKEEN